MMTFLWAMGYTVALSTTAYAQSARDQGGHEGARAALSNGKPDFSGVWSRPGTQDITRTFTNANGTSNKGEPNPLPFTPWGQAQWDNYNPPKNGDYAGSCMPFGWIRSFTPHPMQIVQNNENISFLFEQSTMFPNVNTENLPHRKDWPPSWFGDSRGRWEGDTLVIDVVNLNGYQTRHDRPSDERSVASGHEVQAAGYGAHRIQVDAHRSQDLHPADQQRTRVRAHADVEVMEYACMEGNLQALLESAITPWLGSKDADANLVYDDSGNGCLRSDQIAEIVGRDPANELRGHDATIKLEVAGKPLDVVLAPRREWSSATSRRTC